MRGARGAFFPRGCLLLVAFSSLALHCGPDFSASCTLTYRKALLPRSHRFCDSDSHRTTIGMDTDTPSTETSDRGIHVPILRATNYMDWRRRLIGRLVSKDLHLCASRPLRAAAEAVLQVAIDDRSRGFHSPLERLDFASMDVKIAKERSESFSAPAMVAMTTHHSLYLAGSSSRAPDTDFVWIADTGAGHHFVGDRSLLSDFKESPMQVQLADNSLGQATGYGRMSVKTSQGLVLEFKEMYYLPGSKYGLISMSLLRAGGAKLVYGHGGDTQQVWLDGSLVAETVKTKAKKPSYVFDFEIVPPPSPVLVATTRASVGASLMEWHRKFGHMAPSSILRLVNSKAVVGIRLLDKKIEDCEPCIIAKARAGPHNHVSRKPEHVLQRVSIDLGFVNDDDTKGRSIYMVIVDQLSTYKWAFPLGSKSASEVLEVWRCFQAQVERQSGQKIKFVRSDNGGEFVNQLFGDEFRALGITHELAARYTPQQNGQAERANGSLFALVRAMLKDSGLPKKYWSYAMEAAVFVSNRGPHPHLKGKTAFEVFFGKQPDVSHLRAFGSTAYVLIPKAIRKKLDDHTVKGTFLGYSGEYNYKVRVEHGRSFKIVVSSDVTFSDKAPSIADSAVEPRIYEVEPLQEYELVHHLSFPGLEQIPALRPVPEQFPALRPAPLPEAGLAFQPALFPEADPALRPALVPEAEVPALRPALFPEAEVPALRPALVPELGPAFRPAPAPLLRFQHMDDDDVAPPPLPAVGPLAEDAEVEEDPIDHRREEAVEAIDSDASFGCDHNNGRSVGAYAVIMAGAAISWKSKQQTMVASSTAESETLAASTAAKEAIGLRNLASELRINQGRSTVLHEDNQPCIDLVKNPGARGRTRHWNVHHFYLRERIEVGDIDLRYCPTDLNTADILTKPLSKLKFSTHREGLGMVSLATLACGSGARGAFFPRGCLLLVAFSSLALHCGPDFSASCTLTYRKALLPRSHRLHGTLPASAAAFTTCRGRCFPHSQDCLPADADVADQAFGLAGRLELRAM
ncbi:BZ3500_MvSof-1268-A1-R1_Chr12-3g04039 [Microbotryum saponariae]|uniref:BZ3500_MvSof-1268-A1-R1_Chr12-3g04039 protein n=1 Tax=Microbotryum saponariae TaxID=289078 RepID=A0A2X0KP29_9BASI|nr:BZ3500_MvSof-1268-A1-R1_Chr12-3g04039 [Microbotryum saponariae]SDA02584.1 BZ3501_MvSof-1269-A2-R1_Chr12-3g03694 [Microbotryum saponariae]